MNQRNTANERTTKRHADPPKSDGGVFVKADGVDVGVSRVSSYGDVSAHCSSPAIRKRVVKETGSQFTRGHDPSYSSSHDAPTQNKAETDKSFSDTIPTSILVILWYSLGIVSIATSKILLSTYSLPPLLLTLQQLMIGMLLLRTLLHLQTDATLQSVPLQVKVHEEGSNNSNAHYCENGVYKRKSSNEIDSRNTRCATQQQSGILSALIALANPSSAAINQRIHNQLLLSAIYFTLGFLLTNYGFSSGSAAFVETVKAAEPITSAATAVLWGIEQLVSEEVLSLGGIVVGVVLSTLGHRGSGISSPRDELELATSSQSLLKSSVIVLLANLCFSFRGLHQKLFRSTPQGKATVVDDTNLQYRMQQIGCLLLIIPAVIENPSLPSRVLQYFFTEGISIRFLLRYTTLCILNGIAFASYNLSSTTILTRISVVHHAALNCIRRVFAIVVTSIVFGLHITLLQIFGISVSVGAFFSYTHFKSKKSLQQSRRREMRKKWGSLMMGGRRKKWTGKIVSSSSLPMGSADD